MKFIFRGGGTAATAGDVNFPYVSFVRRGEERMRCRLHWGLLGREGRYLDGGEIEGGFHDRHDAMQVLAAFLCRFAVWGRNERDSTWWAQRSSDADLKVHVTLHEDEGVEDELVSPLWTWAQGDGSGLRTQAVE